MNSKVFIHMRLLQLSRRIALSLALCLLAFIGSDMAKFASAQEQVRKSDSEQGKKDENGGEAKNYFKYALQKHDPPTPQNMVDDSPKQFLILVQGDDFTSREMIEALRRVKSIQAPRLDFTLNPSHPYDLRLIVSQGYGESSGCDDGSAVSISHTTAVGLDSEGKFMFVETYSDPEPKRIFQQLAIMVSTDLNRLGEAIRDEHIPVSVREGAGGSGFEPPMEPGLYQKDGSTWILMGETIPEFKTKQVGSVVGGLLTFGIAPYRDFYVFPDSSAKVRIAQGKPEFYVRGFYVKDSAAAVLELKKDGNQREIQIGSHSIIHNSDKYENTHWLEVTPIEEGLYKMTPVNDLEEGEYIIGLNVSVGSAGMYEFAVTKHKK